MIAVPSANPHLAKGRTLKRISSPTQADLPPATKLFDGPIILAVRSSAGKGVAEG